MYRLFFPRRTPKPFCRQVYVWSPLCLSLALNFFLLPESDWFPVDMDVSMFFGRDYVMRNETLSVYTKKVCICKVVYMK